MTKNTNSVLHVVASENLDISEDLSTPETKNIEELLNAQVSEERSAGSGVPENTRENN